MVKPTAMEDLLVSDGAVCVIKYGSSLRDPTTADDIDYVAVYPAEETRSNLQLADFDIMRLTVPELDRYCRLLNPIYGTEPVLTGDCVAGDSSILEDRAAAIRETSPGQSHVTHLLSRAFEGFRDCMNALRDGGYGHAATRLSFVASYWLFATWYATGRPPATYERVKESTTSAPVLDQIDTMAAAAKEDDVDAKAVEETVHDWQAFLLTDRFAFEEK